MDLKDVSSRFKEANRGQDAARQRAQPPDVGESYRIRAKMVGVLLRDARLNADRSVAECAALLRIAPEQVEAWEYGDSVPSLPQLEILAYYLGVPVSHFWGINTLDGEQGTVADAQTEYMALRDRMIGALLRQAREEAGLSVEQLSQDSGVEAAQITRYELGEDALPLHHLSVLAGGVRKNVSYFLESSSHIGQWLAIKEEWKHFCGLPDDVRQFAANPLNMGFIEIAIMLSQMPADRLRRVGESVLNITM
jgi:transcriptional regulator with XRE-family HTH domain